MKKLLLLSILFLPAFCGCSDTGDGPAPDMIWDFRSYDIEIRLANAQGKDLLDPQTPGAIDPSKIVVEYKGKTYEAGPQVMTQQASTGVSRAYMPPWNGLRQGYSQTLATTLLLFGEFGPSPNYKGESFTIDWGNGKKDVIRFDLYITWKKHEPTVHKAIWLNGNLRAEGSLFLEIKK